jgi:hypothetical protein
MTIPVYSTTLLPDIIGQAGSRGASSTRFSAIARRAAIRPRCSAALRIFWLFDLGYEALSLDQAAQWLAAWQMCGGNWGGMFWFEWISKAATNVLVGTGGRRATNLFTLPVKGASAGTTTIRVNGTPTGVTFQSGTGTNGEDRIFSARRRRTAQRSAPTSPAVGGDSCASEI